MPHSNELKPVPLASGQSQFGTWWKQELQYDFNVAAQLGMASLVDFSTSFKSYIIAYDVVKYSEVVVEVVVGSPNGDLIYGTRWGAGIRTKIEVTNFDSKFDLTLGNIAAAASIGLVNACFTVQGLGVSDPKILGLLPGPGRFDEKTHTQIKSAINRVINDVLIPGAGLVSVPFMILVLNSRLTFAGPVLRSRSQLYTIRRIRDGVSETVAVKNAKVSAADETLVLSLYRNWAETTAENPVPNESARRRAKAWLDQVGA
jgi:hypothetical protein